MTKKFIKTILMTTGMVSMLALTGCGGADSSESADKTTADDGSSEAAGEADASAENETSASGYSFSGKSFVITLYPEVAPITCANFEKLVGENFYNGLTFHRVVDAFMAQGGDPEGNGTGGSGETIKGEFASNGVENRISHQRGVISMARSMDPDSASSQFFICYKDCNDLDGNYAAFGEVSEGMEVVDRFLNCERTLNKINELASQ